MKYILVIPLTMDTSALQTSLRPKIALSMVYILIYPAITLGVAGDWMWVQGWIFSVWFVGISVFATIWLYYRDPVLLEERFRMPGSGDQKKWDQYFLYAIGVVFFVWIIVMPLDAKRYMWSHVPIIIEIVGGLLLIPATFFLGRAFADNTYLSPLVRIQSERKQKVITTGVYAIVRHPMYLGAALMFFGVPLLLGSWYGFVLSIVMVFCMSFRIFGEEKMLIEELEGYKDYMKKVKYRLIPFIW